jgi:ribosomal-protein-alanine N-acetyltransferase
MHQFQIYDSINRPTELEKIDIIDFLYHHLEKYGDSKKDILKAIEYSVKEVASFGGFTMVLRQEKEILGVTVINQTGMEGYIPENILVYIATHKQHRGEGLGKKLMKKAIKYAKGDIALHVEADNPAVYLYKKLGFENPYLEMRLKK